MSESKSPRRKQSPVPVRPARCSTPANQPHIPGPEHDLAEAAGSDDDAHLTESAANAPAAHASNGTADELQLTTACADGDQAAIARLLAEYWPGLDAALRKVGVSDAELADVKQILRRDLLVPEAGARARIAQYDGRGALRAWLRVSAVRIALRRKKRDARETPLLEDRMLEAEVAPHDPELAYMKASYRESFREAFAAAMAALDPKERTILRQSLLDGLSIDELAQFYGTHRATTARWVQSARTRVIETTRAHFAGKLHLSEGECESVLRLLSSHLDITLRRHLVT